MSLSLVCALFSCSQVEFPGSEGEAAGTRSLTAELENVINDYESNLKGYVDYNQVKDELTPTTEKETFAENWVIKAIQDSLSSRSEAFYSSKVRTDATQVLALAPVKVGVFNAGSCSSYREFVYLMDCEDGGWTYSEGNIGASSVDGNGNVVFKFCLVDPGDYGGGALLLTTYRWAPGHGAIDIVERYHDNEDSNNKNEIRDNGGLWDTGASVFTENTLFVWRYAEKRTNLPIRYGVLSDTPIPVLPSRIHIDDQNQRNSNYARLFRYGTSEPEGPHDLGQGYNGMATSDNTTYGIAWK